MYSNGILLEQFRVNAGLAQAKATLELCKTPNDTGGETSLAGVAALSDISTVLFITYAITHIEVEISV